MENNRQQNPRIVWVVALLLAVGTLAVYWPVRHFGFIIYDDPDYVYQNPLVRQGLSWPGLIMAFTNATGANWHPLTVLSHMLDCQFFGVNAGSHHLINLLFHASNTLLLFWVLRCMTGALWRSAFVAAVFGWHPIHVESVAWISERKDVLSAFFFLLTLWAYSVYAGSRSKVYYGLALVCFAFGLMSKPMLVTLPFVLLLLDFWPLCRMAGFKRLLWEKVPFFLFTVISVALTLWAQRSFNAIRSVDDVSFFLRMENALVTYVTYAGKLFWPGDMAVIYVLPKSFPVWCVVGAGVLLALVSVVVVRWGRRHAYLSVGWFWFLGMLIPVIGLVQVGLQGWADRYAYLPFIGLSIMLSWGAVALLERWPGCRPVMICTAGLALALCLAGTRAQVGCWRDSIVLFEHAVRVTSGNYVAHVNLGKALEDEGRVGDALECYQEAVKLNPNDVVAHGNLGKILADQGKLEEAAQHFEVAAKLNPQRGLAHYNYGNVLSDLGRLDEAIIQLREAVRLMPKYPDACSNLGVAYARQNQTDAAMAMFRKAVNINPKYQPAHFNLGYAYSLRGEMDAAVVEFKTAVQLAPNDRAARQNLAGVLRQMKRLSETRLE